MTRRLYGLLQDAAMFAAGIAILLTVLAGVIWLLWLLLELVANSGRFQL